MQTASLGIPPPTAAQEIEELGGTLVFPAPVRHISQDDNGVEVVSDAGT
jgi:phytoene dehydrogenase-like protein